MARDGLAAPPGRPHRDGKTLRDNIAGATVTNREMIRPLSDPLYRQGGLAILRGSLAPRAPS